jgi:hypothetical protein
MIFAAVGIVLMVLKHRAEQTNSMPSIDQGRLQDRIEQVLGSVSLSERNEDAREQTASVEELVAFCTADQPKVSVRKTLRMLHSFLSIGKDDQAPSIDLVRHQIELLLVEGKTKDFEYDYIEPYLTGLVGLTILLEGFRVGNADRALDILRKAAEAFEELAHTKRCGLSTILNAKGICHGILADDPTATCEERLDHLLEANKAFRRQLDPKVVKEVASPSVRYRHAVNEVELLATAYWTWSGVEDPDLRRRGLVILTEMIECDKSGTPRSIVTKLFNRMADHFETAKRIAGDRAARSIRRTAVWHSGFLASIIFAHACADRNVESHPALNSLAPERIPEYVDRVVAEWKAQKDPSVITDYLSYSPIVAEGLKKSDLPNLRNAKAHFETMLADL